MTQHRVELGKTYQDQVTGFTGVATGIVYYVSGCEQVLLNPKVDETSKLRDANWFDIQRVKAIEEIEQVILNNIDSPGCDCAAPVR